MGRRESLAVMTAPANAVIAELVGLLDDGDVALVIEPGLAACCAARRARSTIDLHASQIGAQVVVLHENGDPALPIIIGVLRGRTGWPLAESPGAVEVQADGRRLIVSATDQLTLRCGSARITLTRDGKVLIEGEYISSRSAGVNRVCGGSVHLN
ncbi:MAG: hypothetical protein H7255_15800 [Ramlibacter sp.]|nr:hypothetical protein [Ramlibacter sp.]